MARQKHKGDKRDARQTKELKSVKRDCIAGKANPPEWYAKTPQLLKDAASFPYAWPLGNVLDLGRFSADTRGKALPGIMVMNWVPTVGYATDATSPINVAAINIYSKVRHDNSGKANYDNADLMLYLMAMDSVYAFHSWMRRIYGMALNYTMTNRYMPKALIQAMGVDFEDIQANLANFRSYVNTYAVRASALAIPAGMSIMAKHYWMSESAYYDAEEDKPQIYLFNPVGFYKFTLDDKQAGSLVLAPLFGTTAEGVAASASTSNMLNYGQIVAYAETLLAPIISDEDFGIMSGDILKSYTPSGCFTLPLVDEMYATEPGYENTVLDTIQNTTFVGMPVVESFAITQKPTVGHGYLMTDPKFHHPWNHAVGEYPGQNAFLTDRIVTFDRGDITPELTMEATRWTNISEEVTSEDTKQYRVLTMGSEVMCSARIYRYANSGATGIPTLKCTRDLFVSETISCVIKYGSPGSKEDLVDRIAAEMLNRFPANISAELDIIQQLSSFRRHPAIAVTSYVAYDLTWKQPSPGSMAKYKFGPLNGFLFDINYYTVLQKQDLTMMSNVALLSEFDITVR